MPLGAKFNPEVLDRLLSLRNARAAKFFNTMPCEIERGAVLGKGFEPLKPGDLTRQQQLKALQRADEAATRYGKRGFDMLNNRVDQALKTLDSPKNSNYSLMRLEDYHRVQNDVHALKEALMNRFRDPMGVNRYGKSYTINDCLNPNRVPRYENLS